MYPERYTAEGLPILSCTDNSGATQYGEETCTPIINAYVESISSPVAPCQGEEACNAAISCYTNNDGGLAELTSTDFCDLVEM